ncbi:hypothetical protein [Chishuiella sp.]|uniref:hypothetical protein n=1 Tax=Chishuiella sp. TaxID=1969467 RepID=UPI0028B0E44C|nr:hypothetical protein [Chishuiella sp.]
MKKNLFFIALLLGASVLTFGQSNTFPPSGNVGIGTQNPQAKLEIYGGGDLLLKASELKTKDAGDIIFQQNTGKQIGRIWSMEEGGLNFSGDDNNPKMNLTNDGRFGIGVYPQENVKLDVDGDISARGYSSIGFNTYDVFDYKNQKVANYGLTRVGNEVSVSGWSGLSFATGAGAKMFLDNWGRLGIGTKNPNEKLTVKGKIHAEEVIVDLNVPADYVFQKYYTGKSDLKADYVFPKLNEIETFVKENNHLPDMPSAKEIQENGLKVGEMNNLLLQKIEELTLYIIQQEKEINKMKQDIKLLKNE